MAFFDWNSAIPGLPDGWRKTEGKTIKIAILDSGANLNNSTLQHLDQPGHKFNVARPDYSLASALLPDGGNDNVADQASFGEMHGTACLSVLAGKPANDLAGVKGVAPQAEIFVIKIMESSAMYRKGYILDAIELALKKNVDIITCSVLPSFNGSYTDGRRDIIFKKLRDTNTLLVTSLVNTTMLDVLTGLRFPSDQPESIVAGVAQVPILTAAPPASELYKSIDFLMPAVKTGSLRLMSNDHFPLTTCSSSLATSAMAGVLALMLSFHQRRLSTAEAITMLNAQLKQPYNPAEMLTTTAPAYFHKP